MRRFAEISARCTRVRVEPPSRAALTGRHGAVVGKCSRQTRCAANELREGTDCAANAICSVRVARGARCRPWWTEHALSRAVRGLIAASGAHCENAALASVCEQRSRVHAVCPSEANDPGGQAVHALAPLFADAVPAVQLKQADCAPSENVAGPHSWHADDPC